jgi:lipoprotein LpqH
VKREVLVGVAGAAMVVAAMAGCSNNKSNNSSSNTSRAAAPAQAVTVAGQNQNVSGQTTCTPSNGNINIGMGDPTNGVGAVVSDANPPAVHSVGLGSVNGVTLGFADAAPNNPGNAQVTKTGNSYKITGTATGVDTSNQQAVTKPFEMDVTCP